MLRHQLDGVTHVPRLQHQQSAELLPCFGEWTIGNQDFAAFPRQRLGGPRALKCFARHEVAILPQNVVVSEALLDRKSTRLNSSHLGISYAVFCLKKKTK